MPWIRFQTVMRGCCESCSSASISVLNRKHLASLTVPLSFVSIISCLGSTTSRLFEKAHIICMGFPSPLWALIPAWTAPRQGWYTKGTNCLAPGHNAHTGNASWGQPSHRRVHCVASRRQGECLQCLCVWGTLNSKPTPCVWTHKAASNVWRDLTPLDQYTYFTDRHAPSTVHVHAFYTFPCS